MENRIKQKLPRIEGMLLDCGNLIHISNNISKCKTCNLVAINKMFAKHINLIYLADISKWIINNLKFIELFHSYQNLKEIQIYLFGI